MFVVSDLVMLQLLLRGSTCSVAHNVVSNWVTSPAADCSTRKGENMQWLISRLKKRGVTVLSQPLVQLFQGFAHSQQLPVAVQWCHETSLCRSNSSLKGALWGVHVHAALDCGDFKNAWEGDTRVVEASERWCKGSTCSEARHSAIGLGSCNCSFYKPSISATTAVT